eukprot:CAMPEP_0201518520 /NCGR_PEP_ID=MMETSP0161_2-20130828/9347_1 /ASSEMBLY_ACC=CAM_ASM_000251 /TAXON_ID=180227 /ORGANISM="Neoparamoeba aestuarina, Strain SoJaBio B1-5/56/2" /LENGTH=397 /DNA_ID=CAMNT_0047916317 /DNA_START=136 /DNA_END=1329 /DNA_ORIENTATION=+
MVRATLLFALVVTLLLPLALANRQQVTAVAWLREINAVQHLIIGQVYFYQNDDKSDTQVEVFLFGNENFLPRNIDLAMHIHEYGDVSDRDGRFIGGYFSSNSNTVNGCNNDGKYPGDLGNMFVNENHYLIDGKTTTLTTYNKSRSVIGRSVVLKSSSDSCSSDTVGSPLAMGVIGLAKLAPKEVGARVDDGVWLVAHLFGSSACYRCQGTVWASQESPGVIRIFGKAHFPAKTPNAHQFYITQYGDITTKTGHMMGPIWSDDSLGQIHKLPGLSGGNYGDLGNNQHYSEYDDGDEDVFTWVWLDVTIDGTMSDIVGRGVQVFESYDRGDRCPPTGGGGRLFGFGVFGIASPHNPPPQGLPPHVQQVGKLDVSFCPAGFLGVGLTTFFGLLMALLLVL